MDEKTFFGITNVGVRPTFGKNSVTIETLFFDFDEDIYGKYMEVFPIFQLRQEKKFSSIEALQKQIRKDVEAADRYLIINKFKDSPTP